MGKDTIFHKENNFLSMRGLVLSDRDLKAWLMFIRDRRWSRRQKRELLMYFDSVKTVYDHSGEQLKKVVSGRVRGGFEHFDQKALSSVVDKEFDWMMRHHVSLITYGSSCYPSLLNEIDDPPLALFAMGNISLLSEPQVAIVGSRRPTPIGAKIARQISNQLTGLGIIITSGMALGVDGLAHEGALDGASATIAVMGCGLDQIYPARHRNLFGRIHSSGLILSEYSIGVKPSKFTFPERNRIVSGLSLGVVIIEAAQKSGTLITARLAMEQNREVMVLPGSALSQQYEGSHELIKNGAALITSRDDILFVLKDTLGNIGVSEDNLYDSTQEKDSKSIEPVQSEEEIKLMQLIGAEPVSVEELIVSSGLPPAQVSSIILTLELDEKVAMMEDGGYISIN